MGTKEAKEKMDINVESFGKTAERQQVRLYTLTNPKGLKVGIMTYGATVVSLEVPDKKGNSEQIRERDEARQAPAHHPPILLGAAVILIVLLMVMVLIVYFSNPQSPHQESLQRTLIEALIMAIVADIGTVLGLLAGKSQAASSRFGDFDLRKCRASARHDGRRSKAQTASYAAKTTPTPRIELRITIHGL